MVRYETLVLAVPEITKDETAKIEKLFDQEVKKKKGSVVSFDRWGKYRLAYPIRNNDYGVYFLTRFELNEGDAEDVIKDMRSAFAFKFDDIVMRQITSRLETDDLSYLKPESLEDIPTRDVDSFLRENKMEGLLSSVPSDEEAAQASKSDDRSGEREVEEEITEEE